MDVKCHFDLDLRLLVLKAGGYGHDGVDELHHAGVAGVVGAGHHLRLGKQGLRHGGLYIEGPEKINILCFISVCRIRFQIF